MLSPHTISNVNTLRCRATGSKDRRCFQGSHTGLNCTLRYCFPITLFLSPDPHNAFVPDLDPPLQSIAGSNRSLTTSFHEPVRCPTCKPTSRRNVTCKGPASCRAHYDDFKGILLFSNSLSNLPEAICHDASDCHQQIRRSETSSWKVALFGVAD